MSKFLTPKEFDLFCEYVCKGPEEWNRRGLFLFGGNKRSGNSHSKRGIIYIIQCGNTDMFKVGYTGSESSLSKRLNQLQTASPHTLRVIKSMPGTIRDEAKLHRRMKDYRISGEWFRPNEILTELLSRNT